MGLWQFKIYNEFMIRFILILTIILSNTILSETIKHDVYKLKHRDELHFKILNDKYKYNSDLIVSSDGFIDIKYIGYIYVNNKSIKEVKDLILKLYKKDYFVNPVISIKITKKSKITFVILGQVTNPGYYEVPHDLNVNILDGIAIAGGYTRLAVNVKLLSATNKSNIVFKIKDLLNKKLSSIPIPIIKNKDKIIVVESFF